MRRSRSRRRPRPTASAGAGVSSRVPRRVLRRMLRPTLPHASTLPARPAPARRRVPCTSRRPSADKKPAGRATRTCASPPRSAPPCRRRQSRAAPSGDAKRACSPRAKSTTIACPNVAPSVSAVCRLRSHALLNRPTAGRPLQRFAARFRRAPSSGCGTGSSHSATVNRPSTNSPAATRRIDSTITRDSSAFDR